MKKLLLLISIIAFNFNGSAQSWNQLGNTLTGNFPNEFYGNAIALSADGQTAAVGAFKNSELSFERGKVRVYSLSGPSWVQVGADLNGSNNNDEFGRSVSLSADGSILAVGAWELSAGSGFAQIFENLGGTWTQIGSTISGTTYGDLCGTTVSLSDDGSICAVGSPGNENGKVRIFENISSEWTQIGSDINGEDSGDQFGYAVKLSSDGTRLAIGAYANDAGGSGAGHVRVFENIAGVWTQIGSDIDGEAAGDQSGSILDMNSAGTIVAIGAWRNDGNGSNSGHVRVYEEIAGSWIQVGSDIDGEAAGDQMGNSVAINGAGNIISIGANLNDGGGSSSGHIQIYENIANSWVQIGVDIDGVSAGDECGSSNALDESGYIVATGSRYAEPGGHARVFEYPNCSNTTNTFSTSECVTYTVPSGDETYTTPGTFSVMDTIANVNGCDSIMTINLTIINSATGTDTRTECDSYTWIDGNTYTTSNNTATYNIVGGAANGCDSLSTLDLTIVNSAMGTDTRTECDSYTWIDGNTYTTSNNTATYNIVGGAVNGCDSLSTLDLTIVNSAMGTDTRTECDSYTWIDGNTYTTSNNTATYNIVGGAVNGCDSLVTLDLSIVNSATGTDTRTECNSYTWIDGNTYTTSNNTATYNIVGGAANGCDSLVTLDLTINSISDLSTSLEGITITSNNSSASFQWLDCDNGYAVIDGATSQSFTANANGNYAVELTENGCVDTTSCITITNVGIIENSFGNELLVYPNPTSGNFSIDLGSTYETAQILITDASGKLIDSQNIYRSKIIALSIEEPAGVYFIVIQSAEKKAVIRLVKE